MQFNRCLGCMEEIEGYPCPHCGFDPRQSPASNYVLPYGTVLNGHCVVGKVLGQGGFGITYMGYDLTLRRRVAIKEFYPKGQAMRMATLSATLQWGDDAQSQSFRESGMESFLREAQKMARMEDIPEIVRVRECFQENNTAYIVMDYMEGRTLQSVLKEGGPIAWNEAKDIFFPAICAMERVHQAGMIHRDLSPDNLMLTDKGVRILDLGAAKDLSTGGGTSSQVAKGGFSPLEQYTQRGGSGTWSDVYAMAATMYYTLTGVLPPSSTDRVEEDTLDWELLAGRGVPEYVITALQNAMHVTAKGRTQTMAELLTQLQTGTAPDKKSKRPMFVCAIATMLVVAAAAGILGKQKDKPSMDVGQAALPTQSETAGESEAQEPTAAETTLPTEPQTVKAHVMAAAQKDGSGGRAGEEMYQPFWGQTEYRRADVKTVTFQGTLEGAPQNAQDVSADGDRSVLAWMENGALTVAADGRISPGEDASWMFAYFTNLKTIDFGSCFDTSDVTDMRYMFYKCSSLRSLDVSGFDTGEVTDMGWMFERCGSLKSLDVSGFDTARVTNMYMMFYGCGSLTELNLSGLDTGNVSEMGSMFAFCTSLTKLGLSGFDTSGVTDMGGMFDNCQSLTSLDASSFHTARVTQMNRMFYNCRSLTELNVSGFDTSNVTDMEAMFAICSSLTELDLSGFATPKVTNMNGMFAYCDNLSSLDISKFDASKVTDMRTMFSRSFRLKDLRCTDDRIIQEYNRRWN